ncbi:MAG TPA: hypothetical protein VFT29_12340, partial [Gemmatimonadaceae bacterium]|nr:hypothetical protein [Gemmatimonadaceae bacterium]
MAAAFSFGLQVVLLLAIAIGVSAAVLSIVEQLLVDPVPFADGRRLVLLWNVRRSDSLRAMPTIESVQHVRANARSFRGVEAIETAPLTLAGTD